MPFDQEAPHETISFHDALHIRMPEEKPRGLALAECLLGKTVTGSRPLSVTQGIAFSFARYGT